MNLFLHGVGPDDGKKKPPIKTDDALRSEPSELVDLVLTNPPFGKKSSITVINDEGAQTRSPSPTTGRTSGRRRPTSSSTSSSM